MKNNRAFTYDQINVLYECFKNFSNPLNNRVFVEDITTAASTLDLHLKHPILFKVLQQVENDYKEDAIDFETFITELTDRMVIDQNSNKGHIFDEDGRKTIFDILDLDQAGAITLEKLKAACEEAKLKYTDEQLEKAIRRVTRGIGNEINYDDLERFLQRKVDKNH